MSGLRRSLARGGAQSLVPLSRQRGGRAPRAAFAAGEKGKEGTPLPDETFSLEPGGSGPPSVVAMTMRFSEEVKAALVNAQKTGQPVQLKFGINPQSHILKVGEQEYPFASTDEDPKNFETYVERKGAEARRLVEIGPVVNKLNYQRSLTAAVASKVKQRSVAAEKQLKSRKAIVLEHDSAGQAAPVAKKGPVRKTTLRDKLLPAPKKAKVSGSAIPKLQQQTPSRSQSPAPLPHSNPQQPPGPSRLAVSSPPTEPAVTTVSPLANTGPPSRASATPEEGGPKKDTRVTPAKPKPQATNQELRMAIVSALAGAADNKMRPKSIEKSVQESLPDASYAKAQLDRLLKSVAAFKAPGFWHLNPDVLKAFNEGRIMNTTSPETAGADSPALNLESPPLVTSPPTETETVETAGENKETSEEKAATQAAVDDGAKPESLAGASKEVACEEKKATNGEGETGTPGVPEEKKEEIGRKEENDVSSSGSGSSSSDSSSGSSGSSSSEEEDAHDEAQSSGQERTAGEIQATKGEELGTTVKNSGDGEELREQREEDLRENKERDLQTVETKETSGKGAWHRSAIETTGAGRETEGSRPAVDIERIDDGPAQDSTQNAKVAGTLQPGRSASEKDASSLKRKEGEGNAGPEDSPKKRKVDRDEREARGLKEKSVPVQKDGGEKEPNGKTGSIKDKTGSKKQKLERQPVEKQSAESEGQMSLEREKKWKKPADTARSEGSAKQSVSKLKDASKPDDIVSERQASHAAAGPSGNEDTRTMNALSVYKAAQDKIAEKRANRKAIAIDVQDQTVLDKRKEGAKKVLKNGGLVKGAGNKVVKESGLVKPASAKVSIKPASEKSKGLNISKPLAKVQVEKLDDEGSFGTGRPAKTLPERAEKRKREGEEAGKTEVAKTQTTAGRGGGGFGKSPLEEGELVPTPKKAKLGSKNRPSDAAQQPQSKVGGVPTDKSKLSNVAKPQVPSKPQNAPKASNGKAAVPNGVGKKKDISKPTQKDSRSTPVQKVNGVKVLSRISLNENGSQVGKVKGDPAKKRLNKTKTVSDQDWVKYADVEPSAEPPRIRISSREEYEAALADYLEKWPVYEYLRTVIEEQRQRFLAYDEKIAAARKTHNEQQQRELGLELSVEYSRIRKVHRRMRKAINTLHRDLSVLKPHLAAYASEHGLQIRER